MAMARQRYPAIVVLTLGALVTGSPADAAVCPLDRLIGRGEPRVVVLDWVGPSESTLPDGSVEFSISMYARRYAEPADRAAEDWWTDGTYRTTHYWTLERLGRSYIDCYEKSRAYSVESTVDQANVLHGAFRHIGRGFLLDIEVSRSVCLKDSDPTYGACMRIKVRRGARGA